MHARAYPLAENKIETGIIFLSCQKIQCNYHKHSAIAVQACLTNVACNMPHFAINRHFEAFKKFVQIS